MCRGGRVAVTTTATNDTTNSSSSSQGIASAFNDVERDKNTTPSDTRPLQLDKTFSHGRAEDGSIIHGSLRPIYRPKQSPAIIGIQGTWYDATKFAAHHPGGDIIYEFHRKDATAQFLSYHNSTLLQRLKLSTCGQYPFDETAPGGSKLQGAWMKLNAKFECEGRYRTPPSFLVSRILILLTVFVGMLGMIHVYRNNPSKPPSAFFVGAACMALIWQQSGFLMHDTMHNHILRGRKGNRRLGFFFGNILLGVSGPWWRDEHNEHHIFTNTVVCGVGPADPQMVEDIWCQDKKLVPFFAPFALKLVLAYQQYYWVPILIMVGLLPIKVDAITHTNRYFSDFVGLALHVAWVGSTLWLLPSPMERILFYVVANCFSGCLGIQLLLSHYAKPWKEKEMTKDAGSWAGRQVEAVMDITCPVWLDWFHGGLHIHSVHHLFPRMCRCHYRAVYEDVLSMCKEHGLPIDQRHWFDAIAGCVYHFSTIKEKLASPTSSKDYSRLKTDASVKQ